MASEHVAETIAADVFQGGKAQVNVGGCSEQVLLGPEVAHHHRRVDTGVSSYRPHRGALITLSGEPGPGCAKDRAAGGN